MSRQAAEAVRPIVYVVDDDPSVRAALEDLLSSVSLEARTFASAQAFAQAEHPDAPSCVVLDIRMPTTSGLDLQQELRSSGQDWAIVFITAHGDVAMCARAMKGGAVDFLTKPFREQDLLDAIRAALRRDEARRRTASTVAVVRQRYESLTPGEREVLSLVVAGLPNKQIAARLSLSEITVKVRRSQVMRKMGAESLPDLVRQSALLSIPPT